MTTGFFSTRVPKTSPVVEIPWSYRGSSLVEKKKKKTSFDSAVPTFGRNKNQKHLHSIPRDFVFLGAFAIVFMPYS